MKSKEEIIKYLHQHKSNTYDFEMAVLEVLFQVSEQAYVSGYMDAISNISNSPSTDSKQINQSWLNYKNKIN